MPDIRACKKMVGIMLAVILLSFFGAIQEKMPVNTETELLGAESCVTDTADNGIADVGETRITAAKSMPQEAVIREQKTIRVMPIRFITVVCMLFCAIWVVYRIAMRRFGCRMIDLWENIIYIHKTDGAKGESLLYT